MGLDIPSTEQLLTMGGDERIALDAQSGLNKYGCRPFPDPQILALGSSTASVVSSRGFDAASRLRERLVLESTAETDLDAVRKVYVRELQRIRLELLQLCEISDPNIDLIFAASGTDAHFIAAQYFASESEKSPRVVMVEEGETGSGVKNALAGGGAGEIEVVSVPLRHVDGAPRVQVDIDTDVFKLVDEAASQSRRVLLIMVDQSKTGLIAPSFSCAKELQTRYPDLVDVMVDASQFRISSVQLNLYLQQEFMVILTGSKFMTGPSFSGALFLPPVVSRSFRQKTFPRSLLLNTNLANWPSGWVAAKEMNSGFNMAAWGLLLRWEAALTELRRFSALSEIQIVAFIESFAESIRQRLKCDAAFEPLAVLPLDRQLLSGKQGWDHVQTIFPFLLFRVDSLGGRIPLNRDETSHVYRQLQVEMPNSMVNPDKVNSSLRCQLGQPVNCGRRDGIDVSALRLCLSARLISDAVEQEDGLNKLVELAMASLNKTAWLISAQIENGC